MSRTVLFTGPSLPPCEAAKLIDATVLPPIKRGDLGSMAKLDPQVIGIIDGEFYQSLAVSPREILPFLESGVRVYGSSSMGALRAVELERFGMIGVGRVFRWFRAGVVEADDEVALTYSPWSYRAISEPLVDTRYALRSAVRGCVLTRSESRTIVDVLKAVYFPERTRQRLLSIAEGVVGNERAGALGRFLSEHPFSVKQADARALIELIIRG